MLGVLNSKLISYWFIHKFGKLQRGIFPQFKINELAIFPIPSCSDALKERIETVSERIMELMRAEEKSSSIKAQLEELNKALDHLVYEAFALDSTQVDEIERDLSQYAATVS